MNTSYCNKKDNIVIGERVSCIGSDDATLITIGAGGLYTVPLYPYRAMKNYTTLAANGMAR